jgi:hypothetical protein
MDLRGRRVNERPRRGGPLPQSLLRAEVSLKALFRLPRGPKSLC